MKKKLPSKLKWCISLGVICIIFLSTQIGNIRQESSGIQSENDTLTENDTQTGGNAQTESKFQTEGNTQKSQTQENSSENGNNHTDSTIDVISSIEPQNVLDVSDIQEMAAGTALDVSGFTQETLDSLFYSAELSEEVQQRIWNSSYQENENISLEELRYLRVLYMGFDGQTHIGELIVNQAIAADILEIMTKLYENAYPIEKMVLIDEYGADDERSMEDNNTSAFNYREIAGTSRLSKHSLGLAIDINPRYNPYVKQKDTGEVMISPVNGTEYADRSKEFSYKIDENDLCCQLFLEHGFTWGGSWNTLKDYQHFEKDF